MKHHQFLLPIATVLFVSFLTGCGSGNTSASPEPTTFLIQTAPIESSVTPAQEDGVVPTTSGLVQGTADQGIYRYLGLAYAKAEERFVPAERLTPWEGVFVANEYGAMSPQGAMFGAGAGEEQEGTDNNCQNLNLWTPGPSDGQKRPVMVWLHGGGFSSGTANGEQYDGAALSRSGDVVVVAVNHRLNTFGHLDLSAYGEKYKNSGNVGVMDLVAALEWIQENIEAFGGDPNNVTIFGQSGGGAKVLALMTTPEAKGLFHKGIVQSGATETLGVTFASQESSHALTAHIMKNLNITADNIDELQTVSNTDLQNAAIGALQATAEEFQIPAPLSDGYAMEWGPVVDGSYLPTDPVTKDSFADAGFDIPLLIGSNLNEWAGFSMGSEQIPSEEVVNAFSAAYPNLDTAQASRVDTLIRLPMLKIMSHKADQNGAPVYAYLFTQDDGRGSYHGAEIPYVFHHAQDNAALAEQISQAWVNFAKSGTPSAEGLPIWEAFDREGGATMLLNDKSELVYHHDRSLLELLAPDYDA